MPDMTPAEALGTVLEATTSNKWAEAPAEIIARLRALGFAIVPLEADETAIERIADVFYEANPVDLDSGQLSTFARAAYAAMISPDAEKGAQ